MTTLRRSLLSSLLEMKTHIRLIQDRMKQDNSKLNLIGCKLAKNILRTLIEDKRHVGGWASGKRASKWLTALALKT